MYRSTMLIKYNWFILFASKVKVLHLFIFSDVQESGFGKLYKSITQKHKQ